MPTYQYKCKNCDFEFEDTFKIDDRNIPIENPQKLESTADWLLALARDNVNGTGESQGKKHREREGPGRLRSLAERSGVVECFA